MGEKTGVMFVGACGHLSTTAVLGAMAVSGGLCPATGMVTESARVKELKFERLSDLVFGGWDIRPCSDAGAGIEDIGLDRINDLNDILLRIKAVQADIFPGIVLNAGKAISELADGAHTFEAQSIRAAIDQTRKDISRFRRANELKNVVVINLASTEPPALNPDRLSSTGAISKTIEENRISDIRPSFIYAYAAITSGCGYINFTPSDAGFSQGLVDLSYEFRVPVMGCDGKTGETLVKSALAPMFAMRNLDVLSWEGYNILGNMDGRVLQNPENGATKIKSKDRLLPHILGYHPHSRVSIDYVPSLGDRKTAWDFIHFQGFLNTKMSLQFTWQGCDSALAAPLVLDLARFALFAMEKGEAGPMTHTASFFKSPWGVEEHALEKQFRLLEEYCIKYQPVP